MTASTSPKISTSTSAMRKSWMLIRNASSSPGRVSQNTWALRNEVWTSDQPGALTTIQIRPPKTTPQLAIAIRLERMARGSGPRRRAGCWTVIDQTLPGPGRCPGQPLRLDDGDGRLERQPLRDERVERAVGGHRIDRLVHAIGQLAALGEHRREVLGRAALELPDDRRVVDLDVGDVV